MKSFIVCFNSTTNWYKEDDLYETLKSGETTPVGISLKYMEGSQIEKGDLVFVVKLGKTKPWLLAVGKAITDYDEDPNIEGILIQLDFIKQKGKAFSAFSTLLAKEQIVLTEDMYELLLDPEFVEEIMKTFAVHLMVRICFDYTHDPNIDRFQLLCDYLNDYCPNFRQEVIKLSPLVYKNYKEGEIIDKDIIDLTYDKNAVGFLDVSDFDWSVLFIAIRPRA